MSFAPGSRIGVYEVTAPIGEGGMGQVWRATDSTLGRQVAIKILPDAFASDPERLARFEREAKTLASLNHPHIAAIYGFEAAGPSFQAGTPVVLFPARIVGGGSVAANHPQYAVALDGRFLINQPVADATAAPITLLLNWRPDANR